VAVRAAVRFVAVGLVVGVEHRQERVSTGIDQGPVKMSPECAIAPVLNLDDLVLTLHQFAVPVSHQSVKPRFSTQLFMNGLRTGYMPGADVWPVRE
jgi:hypothetical protein